MDSRTLVLALASAVVVVSACEIFTPATPEIEVGITLEAGEPYIDPQASADPIVECEIAFSARATGPKDAVAVWDGGQLRWYAGPHIHEPIGTRTLSAAEAGALWGGEVLRSGEATEISWNFWNGAPFIFEAEFHFITGQDGSRRSVSARTGCGVTMEGQSGGPPTLADVRIETPSPFQPADSFTVSYVATAPAGLWETRLIISGAYAQTEVVRERLGTEAGQSISLAVPPGVALGLPITIHVEAVDALGRTSARARVESPPLVDETPPGFLFVSTRGSYHDYLPDWLTGQYAVGDTLQLIFRAADNQELGHLVYEVGDRATVRDSVSLDGYYVHGQAGIPMREDWLGSPGLAVHVTDAVGLQGPRYEARAGNIRVFPLASRRTDAWSTNGRAIDTAWDEDRGRLYITIEERPELIVVASSTMTSERVIALPSPPAHVDYLPGGGSVVVTLPDRGSLGVIDLGTGKVAEIPLTIPGIRRPELVTVLGDDRVLITAMHDDGLRRILEIDLQSGSQKVRPDAIAGESDAAGWIRMARSGDRSKVGVLSECLVIYSAATDAFGGCLPMNPGPGPLSADATGRRFALGDQVADVGSGAVDRPVWGLSPWGFEVSTLGPDGATLYLSDVKGVIQVRVRDGIALERVPLPIVYGKIFVSRNGERLITAGTDLDVWPYRVVVHSVAGH